jgi:DNA polymerase-3 subunit alpha
MAEGELQTALEKMIRFGNMVQSQTVSSNNTLFGDLPNVLDIKHPQIPNCRPWSLTEQLDKEKEVTGIYLSGHPLDHYKFEIRHYGITSIQDFNEIKESVLLAASGKTYKLICLVSVVNHRISRQGNKFGSFTLEDYTGKTEIVLFGDDYIRHHPFFQPGQAIFITGSFKQRYSKSEFEFKLTTITLAENIKKQYTKQLQLELDARIIEQETIEFLEKNMKSYPGKASLRIIVTEPKTKLKANFITLDNGFEMNNDLIKYLEEKPEIEVQVS